jgi:predicted kinase
MAKKLPRLVIVSGASASGKSSIARDLAAELKLALLAKDDLKEGLFDSLGNPRDEAESQRLGTASYLLIERIGTRILESGVGLVVEGNFWRGRAEPRAAGRALAPGDRPLRDQPEGDGQADPRAPRGQEAAPPGPPRRLT